MKLHTYLTSVLDGGEWSASRPGRFTPRERAPGLHWIGGLVGPRAGLETVSKREIPNPSGNRTQIIRSPKTKLNVDLTEHKADHSPPSSAEVKNAWSYTCTPSICYHGVVLIWSTETTLPLYLIGTGRQKDLGVGDLVSHFEGGT
jgi:hypothetical protein